MSGPAGFGRLRPAVLLAAAYALATATWVAAGSLLPGGRWLAVHLFTLGVLTNLVLSLSQHFARKLLHQRGVARRWELSLANAGTVAVLWGLPSGQRWVVAAGAAAVTGAVLLSYARLRRLRVHSKEARFAWIVRIYERAHGAFVHGALLGALIGTGVLTGAWYLPARTAHLHVNVLGWGGLTLLATVVFLGPAIARTRIEQGADARAARALRLGATALTLGVLALLATGIGGIGGIALRVLAAAGLGVYAWAVAVTALPVARAALRARPTAGRPLVVGAAWWFVAVAWADVAVVATGSWRYLDALGVGLLAGVLGQGILAALGYLAPLVRGAERPARDVIRGRLERGGAARAAAWNAGVLLAALAAAAQSAGEAGAWASRIGWGLAIAAALGQAVASLLPVGASRAESQPTYRAAAP